MFGIEILFMKARTYQILSLTCGLQLLFIVVSLNGGFYLSFVQGLLLQMLLPPISYAIGLYRWPKLANLSAVPKMTIIVVTSIVLTIAAQILTLLGYMLYFRIRYGVFPLGWGHE
jgi:hypothetical protein